jgi:hypothetical protein
MSTLTAAFFAIVMEDTAMGTASQPMLWCGARQPACRCNAPFAPGGVL